jgi:hypothetical protein
VSGFIGVAIVLVLAVLCGWLSTRAWRLRNTAGRIVGGLLTALLTLVFAAVAIVGVLGVYRLNAPHGQPGRTSPFGPVRISSSLAGRRVSGCANCHSSTGALPLDGGSTNFLGGSGFGPGVVVPPNLTPGGPLNGRKRTP